MHLIGRYCRIKTLIREKQDSNAHILPRFMYILRLTALGRGMVVSMSCGRNMVARRLPAMGNVQHVIPSSIQSFLSYSISVVSLNKRIAAGMGSNGTSYQGLYTGGAWIKSVPSCSRRALCATKHTSNALGLVDCCVCHENPPNEPSRENLSWKSSTGDSSNMVLLRQ